MKKRKKKKFNARKPFFFKTKRNVSIFFIYFLFEYFLFVFQNNKENSSCFGALTFLLRKSVRAPEASRNAATDVCPRIAAIINGVTSRESRALTSPPADRRSWQTAPEHAQTRTTEKIWLLRKNVRSGYWRQVPARWPK